MLERDILDYPWNAYHLKMFTNNIKWKFQSIPSHLRDYSFQKITTTTELQTIWLDGKTSTGGLGDSVDEWVIV